MAAGRVLESTAPRQTVNELPRTSPNFGGVRGECVLVVDDDTTFLERISGWLLDAGWTPIVAASISDALKASSNPALSLALVDYRLGERAEGVRLARILKRRRGLPFVLVSAFLTTEVVVSAMNAGALHVLDKPLTKRRLEEVLGQATSGELGPLPTRVSLRAVYQVPCVPSELRSVALRWAHMVLKACHAQDDPRTVQRWGQAIGVSASTIDETCRLCDVTAIDSRDLSRCLRALYLANKIEGPLEIHLAIADERTLNRILGRAGISRHTRRPHLSALLTRQSFIPKSRPCLHELAHLAGNSPLFY